MIRLARTLALPYMNVVGQTHVKAALQSNGGQHPEALSRFAQKSSLHRVGEDFLALGVQLGDVQDLESVAVHVDQH